MRRIQHGWEKEFRLDSNDCGFICAGVNFVTAINDTPCFIWVVCNKLNTVSAHTHTHTHTHTKMLVSWQFSGPYGVTKYGNGWRKDVVNQCLSQACHKPTAASWMFGMRGACSHRPMKHMKKSATSVRPVWPLNYMIIDAIQFCWSDVTHSELICF